MKPKIQPAAPVIGADALAVTGTEARKCSRSNPDLIGVGLGVLSWAAFAVMNQPLAVSTSLSAAFAGVFIAVEIFERRAHKRASA